VIEGEDVMERLSKVWGQNSNGFDTDGMGFLKNDEQNAPIVLSLAALGSTA
jgi:hypothetical protein